MGWFGTKDQSDNEMIIKGLKADKEQLNKTITRITRENRLEDEAVEDRINDNNRRNAKEVKVLEEEHEEELKSLRRDTDEEIREIKDEARDDVRSANDDADERVRAAEAKVQVTANAVREAVLIEREKNQGAETKLEIKVAVAEGKASAEAARADAAESLIEAVENLLENANDNHTDFTKLILAKIAEVKLDKFNINVEVPAPEVTIIGGGQQKSNEQKK